MVIDADGCSVCHLLPELCPDKRGCCSRPSSTVFQFCGSQKKAIQLIHLSLRSREPRRHDELVWGCQDTKKESGGAEKRAPIEKGGEGGWKTWGFVSCGHFATSLGNERVGRRVLRRGAADFGG